MKNIVYIVIIGLIVFPVYAINLQNGVSLSNEETESNLYSTFIPYAIARQGQRQVNDDNLVISFIEFEQEIVSLSDAIEIVKTNKSDRSVIGNWPLTRWSHEYIPNELTQRLQQPYTYQFKPNIWLLNPTPGSTYRGCLYFTPLRYGDIDNNNSDELIIFGMDDIVIFSPQS